MARSGVFLRGQKAHRTRVEVSHIARPITTLAPYLLSPAPGRSRSDGSAPRGPLPSMLRGRVMDARSAQSVDLRRVRSGQFCDGSGRETGSVIDAMTPSRSIRLCFCRSSDGRVGRMPLRARHIVASLGVAVILSACGSSSVDRQHLAVLRRDALATAQAPGTTPWLVQGQAGGRGIGFGGSSPTVLNVDRRLQDRDRR
jgi:hypothetical protein